MRNCADALSRTDHAVRGCRTSAWRPYLCSLPEHVPLPIFYSPKKYERVRREQVPEHERERFDELVEGRRDALEVGGPDGVGGWASNNTEQGRTVKLVGCEVVGWLA